MKSPSLFTVFALISGLRYTSGDSTLHRELSSNSEHNDYGMC